MGKQDGAGGAVELLVIPRSPQPQCSEGFVACQPERSLAAT